ncbi:MAG: SatD family protein [Bacteroidetes bacterium]|nr:SatD family protein [Bacteroidota bacterium]
MIDLTKQYFLLVLDVENSSTLPNNQLSVKMKLVKAKLKQFNRQFYEQIIIPLTISYGDEIAGLFTSPENFFSIFIDIRRILCPLTTVRFVAIKGSIAVDSPDIRQIGGQVFKSANEAMMKLKEKKDFFSWQTGLLVIDRCLESLCEISNSIVHDMSQYQREVFELLNAGLSQKQIADRLGKFTQSVWNVAHRSKSYQVLQAQNAIILMLKETKWDFIYFEKTNLK